MITNAHKAEQLKAYKKKNFKINAKQNMAKRQRDGNRPKRADIPKGHQPKKGGGRGKSPGKGKGKVNVW